MNASVRFAACLSGLMLAAGCSGGGSQQSVMPAPGSSGMGIAGSLHMTQNASMNGRAGTMPAFYDDKLFTINFKQLAMSQAKLLLHNKSLNTIYMDDAGLPGGQMFTSVLDAIQGDGFNPLWQEVQISFAPGVTPHQFTSDTDILAAAAAHQITLTPTGEVYRCSVIGPGK